MNYTRPPPPRGAPPSYAIVTRMYRRSLRPIVIAFGFLGALWSLLWGVAAFRDISIDKTNATRLAVFDIVLGSLYLATCAIELVGIAGAAFQRLFLVRVYAFLSLGAAILIIAAGLIRVIIHFAFKSELINECITLATGETLVTRFGLWGPTSSQTLNQADATDFCNNGWSHDSFSELAWLLVVGVLGPLFAAIAFAYYRQLLDPTSPANAGRAPSARARGAGGFPAHYAPPYAPDLPYDGGYAPPPGPPPADDGAPPYERDEGAKLPGYGVGAGDLKGFAAPDKKADPFADFEERDVTSRPAPGGSERF